MLLGIPVSGFFLLMVALSLLAFDSSTCSQHQHQHQIKHLRRSCVASQKIEYKIYQDNKMELCDKDAS